MAHGGVETSIFIKQRVYKMQRIAILEYTNINIVYTLFIFLRDMSESDQSFIHFRHDNDV